MAKAFKILLCLSCIVYAQAAVTVENEYEDGITDLNCVMFGNTGCDATCTTLSELYDTPVHRGACNENSICVCSPKQKLDLESRWYSIFQKDDISKSVLEKIKKNSSYTQKTEPIMGQFPRRPEDIADEITQTLTEVPDIEYLQVAERSLPVSEFLNDDDDVIDSDKLRQTISEILKKSLRDNLFRVPKTINYQAKLKKFFDTTIDDEIRSDVYEAIHKCGNSLLEKHLDSSRRSTVFDFNTIADLPSYMVVSDYVSATVTNDFITIIEDKKTNVKKPPPKRAQKKSPTKPNENKQTKTDEKELKPTDNTKTPNDAKYETPKFDNFPSVTDIGSAFTKNFEMDKGNVRYERKRNGDVEIRWAKNDILLVFVRFTDGKLQQNWTFGDKVKIYLKKDGPIDLHQFWDIEGRNYVYEQSPGTIRASGGATAQDIAKYKKEIDTWCAQNRHIIPENLCVIYKRSEF